jgi:hypothetical protein
VKCRTTKHQKERRKYKRKFNIRSEERGRYNKQNKTIIRNEEKQHKNQNAMLKSIMLIERLKKRGNNTKFPRKHLLLYTVLFNYYKVKSSGKTTPF